MSLLAGAHKMAVRISKTPAQQLTALNLRCISFSDGGCAGPAQVDVPSMPAWALRSLHDSAQLRAAENGRDGIDSANQELDEFFGVRHHSEHTDASNSRGDSQGEESGDLSFRKQESRPTDMDPILAHPVPTPSGRLTHVDSEGRASMVDIAKKISSQREAKASAKVVLGSEVYQMVAGNTIAKGDVLTVAELAGIMGAKHTSFLIPLCHNIPLSYVDVKLHLLEAEHAVGIRSDVRTFGPTGVEMEALTAASTAALTIYDMCKAVSRRIVIKDIQLEMKTGGKSGTYVRASDPKSDVGGK